LFLHGLIGKCAVGEANNGKASKSVAKYTSGIGQAQENAGMATSAIAQAKMVSFN